MPFITVNNITSEKRGKYEYGFVAEVSLSQLNRDDIAALSAALALRFPNATVRQSYYDPTAYAHTLRLQWSATATRKENAATAKAEVGGFLLSDLPFLREDGQTACSRILRTGHLSRPAREHVKQIVEGATATFVAFAEKRAGLLADCQEAEEAARRLRDQALDAARERLNYRERLQELLEEVTQEARTYLLAELTAVANSDQLSEQAKDLLIKGAPALCAATKQSLVPFRNGDRLVLGLPESTHSKSLTWGVICEPE